MGMVLGMPHARVQHSDPSDTTVLTSIELFTGGGGMAQGMSKAGFRHLLLVEMYAQACESLLLNKKAAPLDRIGNPETTKKWPLRQAEVEVVDFKPWESKVDVVAGGVPCQPWSVAGSKFEEIDEKIGDDRNLWPEFFRAIQETRPRAFVAENVAGLLRTSFQPYYDYIIRELKAPFERRIVGEKWYDHDRRLVKALMADGNPSERYIVQPLLLNAADYGDPQFRKRLIIVGYRADLGIGPWKGPTRTHSEATLLFEQASGLYWERHGIPPRKDLGEDVLVGDEHAAWRTVRDAIWDPANRLPEPILDRQETPGFYHHVGWPGARHYHGHRPSDLDRPAKTVKAGTHGVGGGECTVRLDDGTVRYLTVREVARLMSFPDDWRLAGARGHQMRQLGNAVPVRLATAVGRSVVQDLRRAKSR